MDSPKHRYTSRKSSIVKQLQWCSPARPSHMCATTYLKKKTLLKVRFASLFAALQLTSYLLFFQKSQDKKILYVVECNKKLAVRPARLSAAARPCLRVFLELEANHSYNCGLPLFFPIDSHP